MSVKNNCGAGEDSRKKKKSLNCILSIDVGEVVCGNPCAYIDLIGI
jgi:hypothetical protein